MSHSLIQKKQQEQQDADYTFYIDASSPAIGERLDKYIASELPFSRNLLQQWLEQGAVLVNQTLKARSYKIKTGDVIEIFKQALPSELAFVAQAIDLDIVFEDEDLLIVHKPIGMVCHPAPGNWQDTLVNALLYYLPENKNLPRAGLVHRLDKMTSGLLVVAKHLACFYYLTDQLQNRWFKRDYLAIVQGVPPKTGVINSAILRHPQQKIKMKIAKNDIELRHAKPALTHYQRLASLDFFSLLNNINNVDNINNIDNIDNIKLSAYLPQKSQFYSLVHCRLATGRTHQIRLHLSDIGHGLLGDAVYHESLFSHDNLQKLKQNQVYNPNWRDTFFEQQRQALHAASLGLILPKFILENTSNDLKNMLISAKTTERHLLQIQKQNQPEYQKPSQKWFAAFNHYQEFQILPKDDLLADLLKKFKIDELNGELNYTNQFNHIFNIDI